MSRSSYPPAMILKGYRETLPGLSHYSVQMGSTTCCSLKAASLKMTQRGNGGQNLHFKKRRGRGSAGGHTLSGTLPTTQIPTIRKWINQLCYFHKRDFYSAIKNCITDTCNNMDESHKFYAEPKKPDTKKHTYCTMLFLSNFRTSKANLW